MIIHVYQTIAIHNLAINSLANSSVLQIGSAGVVRGLSNNYNTGGYTGSAPEAAASVTGGEASLLVPLPAIR